MEDWGGVGGGAGSVIRAVVAFVAVFVLSGCGSGLAPETKGLSQPDPGKRAAALSMVVGVLQEVQANYDTMSRDADLGLASEVTADCRTGYQAVPGWRSTVADVEMPATIKTPLRDVFSEFEAGYLTCVARDWPAAKLHFSAAVAHLGRALVAVKTWNS
jgi:hypothetical protein